MLACSCPPSPPHMQREPPSREALPAPPGGQEAEKVAIQVSAAPHSSAPSLPTPSGGGLDPPQSSPVSKSWTPPSIGHNRIKTLRGQQWFWLRARAVEGSHSSDSPGLSNRHSASRVMEGTQAEQTSFRPRDSPDHSSRWVCGLRLPWPHLQALLSSQHSRRLPRPSVFITQVYLGR